MKVRILSKTILKAVKTFPAVVVTGPRQSGKTTLLKQLFLKSHRFVTLEDPDIRMRAREDPVGFFQYYKNPLILDEIQYVPELLSYIKTKIDENRKPGQWLFTGSQNFALMQGVSQSLAGRAAVLSLLPFSYSERIGNGEKSKPISKWLRSLKTSKKSSSIFSLSELILRGHFPEIASKKTVDRSLWCGSYITTYLERDVRNLSQIGDLNQFERFLRLCAARTGQILNITDMARDIGVSVGTAKRWISILETGYLLYLLYPYYKNIGKRWVKSPKMYFCDTALASYLLGLHDAESLIKSPNFGHLFETFVVIDFLKRFLHFGQLPSMYSMKTRDGLEVDLVIEEAQKLHLFEIKSSATITTRHANSLKAMKGEFPDLVGTASVISHAPQSFPIYKNIFNYSWRDVLWQ